MDEHTAYEQAYKNGYEKGYRDGKDSAMESIMFPKYFDHVLINVTGDKPFTTVHEAHLRKDNLWDTGLYRYDPEDVTHWMPLPEPPKGD